MDALRAGLCARGRWSAADRLAGPDYAPGLNCPEWTDAVRLANRGVDRAAAVRAARAVIASGSLWHGVLVLHYAGERFRIQPQDDVSTLLVTLNAAPRTAARMLDDLSPRPALRGVATAWLVQALIACDDLPRANEVLGRNESEDVDGIMARGLLHFAEGKLEHALDAFLACGRALTSWGVTNPAVQPWRSKAALCAYALGRPNLAMALARSEFLAAQQWGTGQAIGTAEHALAVVSGAGPGRLRGAVTTLERAGAHGILAQARHDLGLALAARGRVDDARRTLLSVRSCDQPLWTNRAETELRRIALVPNGLTTQERSIASLARAGLSNPEIASRLFLALRTVEFHLSGVYRKLGIHGRRDLGRVLTAL